MKKWIIVFLTVILTILSVTYSRAEEPHSSIYCDEEEAESLYEMLVSDGEIVDLMRNEEFSICKDKIMPIYEMNLVNYAKTGTITLKPFIVRGNIYNPEAEELTYVAVIMDKNNEYDGYLEFGVQNGHATVYFFVRDPSEMIDYSDNVEAFRYVYDTDVPESYVKFVSEPTLGYGFYITYEGRGNTFVYPKKVNAYGETHPTRYLYEDIELKEEAEKVFESYSQSLEAYKKWRRSHPEGQCDLMGYSVYRFDPEDLVDNTTCSIDDPEETENTEEELLSSENMTQNPEAQTQQEELSDGHDSESEMKMEDHEKGFFSRYVLIPGVLAAIMISFICFGLLLKKKL